MRINTNELAPNITKIYKVRGGGLIREIKVTPMYGDIYLHINSEAIYPVTAKYKGENVILKLGETYKFIYGDYTDIIMPDDNYYIGFQCDTHIDEIPRIINRKLIIPRYFSGFIGIEHKK